MPLALNKQQQFQAMGEDFLSLDEAAMHSDGILGAC